MLGLKRAAEGLGVKAQGMRLSQAELTAYVNGGYGVLAFVHPHHYVWVKHVQSQGVVIKDLAPEFQFLAEEAWERMWFDASNDRTPPPDEGRGTCLVLSPPQ